MNFINRNAVYRSFILFLIFFSFFACQKDDITKDSNNLNDYKEPNLPKKDGGRFLKSIYADYSKFQNIPNSSLESGIKVEFFYNSKNYVTYFQIGGIDGLYVKIEYNNKGLVNRIKYFDKDSTISSYELFEYDDLKRLCKMSRFERLSNLNSFEVVSYNEFDYPSMDTIIEQRYFKAYDFKRPFKDIYIYDENRNIKEKFYFDYKSTYPYSSNKYFYNSKKRPFDKLELPIYSICYNEFQMSEIFSINHNIGFMSYTYNNGKKIDSISQVFENFKYDSLDFPSSDGITYYNYVDLE